MYVALLSASLWPCVIWYLQCLLGRDFLKICMNTGWTHVKAKCYWIVHVIYLSLFFSPYAQSIMSFMLATKWLHGYNLSCVPTSLLLLTVCSAQLSSAQDGWMVCCSKAVMSLWPILTGTRSQEPLLLTTDTKPATCGLWTGVCTASWNEASSQRFLCERARECIAH